MPMAAVQLELVDPSACCQQVAACQALGLAGCGQAHQTSEHSTQGLAVVDGRSPMQGSHAPQHSSCLPSRLYGCLLAAATWVALCMPGARWWCACYLHGVLP
jgi:hypothetical protein